jgi:hypothetical protein
MTIFFVSQSFISSVNDRLAIESTRPDRSPSLALTTRQTLTRVVRLSLLRWLESSFTFNSIYFNVGGANRPRTMLGRMSVLGGAITELLSGVVGPVTFAPDGKQMAFLQRDGGANQTSIIIADAS